MRTLLLAAAFSGCILTVSAQSMIAAKAGLISYSEGEVYLDGKRLDSSAGRWPQMQENATLRSGFGRVEFLLNPCAVLHLDRNSALRLTRNRLTDTRVELLSGAAVVQVAGRRKYTSVTLAVTGFAVTMPQPGMYRLNADPPALRVFGGKAEVAGNGWKTAVGQGRSLALADGAGTTARFDWQKLGGFEFWSRRRMGALFRASGSMNARVLQKAQEDETARKLAALQAQIHDPAPPNPDTQPRIPPVGLGAGTRLGGCGASGW
jgi:hypothetical protein